MNKIIGFIKYTITPKQQIDWKEFWNGMRAFMLTIGTTSLAMFLAWLLGKFELMFDWHMFAAKASTGYNDPFTVGGLTVLIGGVLFVISFAFYQVYKGMRESWLDYLETLENKS